MHTKEFPSKIPIQDNMLNKYSTFKEIFDSKNKHNIKAIKLYNMPKLKNADLKYLKIESFKKLCNNIFNQYYNINYFYNNDNKIFVSKAGINESAQKIFNNRIQRDLMLEHLLVFANLGIIIENAYLVNQTLEHKKRVNTSHWNYYIICINIVNKIYLLEFEVRSMIDGQNHYRIQRIEIKR